MNGVKCANGSEDRQCPGHPKRAARGHGDTRQLTETRNHALKKQLPPTEGVNVADMISDLLSLSQQQTFPENFRQPSLQATSVFPTLTDRNDKSRRAARSQSPGSQILQYNTRGAGRESDTSGHCDTLSVSPTEFTL
ncbi:hypothetical protein PAMA_012838 [Pampus argenteus]